MTRAINGCALCRATTHQISYLRLRLPGPAFVFCFQWTYYSWIVCVKLHYLIFIHSYPAPCLQSGHLRLCSSRNQTRSAPSLSHITTRPNVVFNRGIDSFLCTCSLGDPRVCQMHGCSLPRSVTNVIRTISYG